MYAHIGQSLKRNVLAFAAAFVLSLGAWAQSGMTDTQIMDFVKKEHNAGTSNSQIVTKLMQRGVTVDRLRRLKNKYERENGTDALGARDLTGGVTSTGNRSRKQNGGSYDAKNRLADGRKQGNKHTYDEDDEEYVRMDREFGSMMSDSLGMFGQKDEAKWRGRKVFGRDIFNNKELSFEPNMNIATPDNYRLGPGDAVYIDIYGASQKTVQTTVTPDGTVVVEGFGPVGVGGLTVAQANARLRSTLGARYSSSRVKLTVGQTRTIMVNVMGEVENPGTYTLSAFATVFHALYMAGGVNELGTLRDIKVYRGNKLVTTVDIYDYILNGKLTGNVRLADNDVIVVGPYDCLVNLTGKVKRPMFYEMKKNESLATLLKYGGGFAGDAYKKSVRVVRKAGTQYSVHSVGEFDMASFRLSDEDSVSVDSVLPRYSNMVEVRGAVFRPGMYQVGGAITSVRTLLEAAEGVTEDAFTARGVMHRMKADRTLEALAVDVAGILSGKVADVPLRNEDVLYIPSKKELQEERTITIYGEVMYPGVYNYADNETLEDFVLQAGGLTNTASIMRVDVSRRISDSKALAPSDTIASTYTFALKDGFVIDGTQGFVLQPFDQVYVRSSPGYSAQKNVAVDGEVVYAGTYTLARKSQRLSELVEQAGGLTNTAYALGARLVRKYTTDELDRRDALLRQARAQAGGSDSLDLKKLDLSDTYVVGIDLQKALERPGSNYDIVLREGDRLVVPEYSGTVKISGDVMSPNTVPYREGKGVSYYINQAGGFGSTAKKSRTYIVYMNGQSSRTGAGVRPMPGCEIVVPSKQDKKGMTTAETVAIASGTASLATVVATLVNLLK